MSYNDFDINDWVYRLKTEMNKLQNENHELIKNNLERTDTYSYTIDKQTFIDCMEALKSFEHLIHNLNDLGINAFELKPVNHLENAFTSLLSKCVNDDIDIPGIGSDLSYFIWDLNWGEKYKPGSVTDENNNPIDMSSIESMWNYFSENNMKLGEKE